ncbi:MAG: FHA domain-containing protein [Acidimicrobiales bacterium]|jgi:hypothetical protein
MTPGGCPACGLPNTAGATFCPSCGSDLRHDEITTETPAVVIDPAALAGIDRSAFGPHEGLFVVVQGAKSGARYALDQDVTTVGRHPTSDIFLDDITVSRRHAEVRRDGARYWVSDVGSLNGTYVNRDRTEGAELVDGDEMQVGKFKLVFVHGTGEV